MPAVFVGPIPEMASFPNIWGVFDDNGSSVFDVDSIQDLDYDNASKISTFPVEKGGFTSFNKAQNPYTAKIKMMVSGDDRINALLTKLDQEAAGVDLRTIATPQKSYTSANLEKFSYARTQKNGAGLVTVNCTFVEVRQVTPQYATVALPAARVKKPGASSKADAGKQQTQAPPKKTFQQRLQETIDRAQSSANKTTGTGP